ncbi:MAG TPA: HD domain-containing protein [Gammaproteobacteria bacterium]|nr:HD domain-containing protein [Gammaproteobacteria bacterium]
MNESHKHPVRNGLFILLALLAAGAVGIHSWAERERQRDLDAWAIRLGLVAEARVEAIEAWLAEQRAQLGELADNASVQLYLWQLNERRAEQAESADKKQKQGAQPGAEPAQLTYLRNLVRASADRLHLAPQREGPPIPANLPQREASGLALLDENAVPVAATRGMPEIGSAFRQAARQALETGRPVVSELVLDSHDRPLLGIAQPIPVVLGAQTERHYVGTVFAVFDAARDLFPLLQRGIPTPAEEQSILVTAHEGKVVYLSPTPGGLPTRHSLPLDRPRLAAATAVREPGGFGEYLDYRGRPVLAASRALRSLPWVLVEEIDATTALKESRRHRRSLITTFSLLLVLAAAVLVAAWRHGSSVRARENAEQLRRHTEEVQNQAALLRAVTDNTEAHIVLLDSDLHILFANRLLAASSGMEEPDALLGDCLGSVLGPANAAPLVEAARTAQSEQQTQHLRIELSRDGEIRALQCSLVPVACVGDERRDAVLLVMHDITELEAAQQRHEQLLRKLVDTLMHVVDLHDPYSGDHTARVVEVANAIGRELELPEQERESLDLAASLANLGKIFVPREVLTKTEPLTEVEQVLLHRHVQFGVELLEDLDFEGPVLETIRQKQEHLDGSGYPQHLSGDQIILTARILAVANAFVALVSPRAYRQAVDIEQALDQLLREAGHKYDRRVIAALFHVAENRADWHTWQQTS